MLVIRMQRTGRKGHAQFRVVVQDSRRTPTSGKIVAALGNYNPHTKTAVLDKEAAQKYLDNGAQPSDRVARLLQAEGVKLPKWAKLSQQQQGKIRNPDKLRRNRPAEEAAEEASPAEAPAPEGAEANEVAAEASEPTEAPAEAEAADTAEVAAEEPKAEAEETEASEE